MNKLVKSAMKYCLIGAMAFSIVACNQSPVRNPLAGRKEPKLSPLPTIAEKAPVHAQVAWSANVLAKQDPYVNLKPTVSENGLYAADKKGNLVLLDTTTGKVRWQKNVGEKLNAGPAIVNDTLLVASHQAKVLAYDKQTGEKRWEAKVPSAIAAAPGGSEQVVLVHTVDGTLTALNIKNGERLWQAEHSTPTLTLSFSSRPQVINNKVLVGLSSGKLMAFDLHDGQTQWERLLSMPRGRSELQRMVDISADPVIVDDVVYAINYSGKLSAVQISSSALLWERDISAHQNMAVNDNTLFITDNNHHLWAVDRHTGVTQWKQDALSARYITGPVANQQVVVVADRGGYVHYLSAETGNIINRTKLSGKFYQNPVSDGNQFFVRSSQGKVTALRWVS